MIVDLLYKNVFSWHFKQSKLRAYYSLSADCPAETAECYSRADSTEVGNWNSL